MKGVQILDTGRPRRTAPAPKSGSGPSSGVCASSRLRGWRTAHGTWIQTSLTTVHTATVALSEIPAGQLVLLLSDGLDAVPHAELADLVQQHAADPGALAAAVVAAAREVDGYRDDATAVVVLPPSADDR